MSNNKQFLIKKDKRIVNIKKLRSWIHITTGTGLYFIENHYLFPDLDDDENVFVI